MLARRLALPTSYYVSSTASSGRTIGGAADRFSRGLCRGAAPVGGEGSREVARGQQPPPATYHAHSMGAKAPETRQGCDGPATREREKKRAEKCKEDETECQRSFVFVLAAFPECRVRRGTAGAA